MTKAQLTQLGDGVLCIDAYEKHHFIASIPIKQSDHPQKDRDATTAELHEYRSLIAKRFYIGRLSSPVIAFHESQAATKCQALKLHHLYVLNVTLRKLIGTETTIKYYRPAIKNFQTDAAFQL